MKRNFFLFLILGTSLLFAAAEVEVRPNVIIMRNAGAEYHFDHGKQYHLLQSWFQGRKIWPSGMKFTYNMPGDNWYYEDRPLEQFRMGPYQHKIIKKGDRVTLETGSDGVFMSLRRSYTLREYDPTLEVDVRVDIQGENRIRWTNLFTMPIPATDTWLRLVSRIENGQIRTQLETFRGNPFIYENGNRVNMNGEPLDQWQALSLLGSYDPVAGAGALIMNLPEESPWRFRAGITGNSENGYRGFSGLSPYYYTSNYEGGTFLQAKFVIYPFQEDPLKLNQAVIPAFVEKLRQASLIDTTFMTGKKVHEAPGLVLWKDLPHNRVFRDEQPPSESKPLVELFAARGEGESFQLVLKSEKTLQNVTLRISGFENNGKPITIQWYAVDYSRADLAWDSDMHILGEIPDNLLPSAKRDCEAGQVQPFLVTFHVPLEAKPGICHGKIEVMADNAPLAIVPVHLQVWNFSLQNATLTAALDFWVRYNSYIPEKRQEIFRQVEEMVVKSRGGSRWLDNPRPAWDAEGNLVSIDYDSFDRSALNAIEKYRHNILVVRSFMLGFGHHPRKNLFGEADEILSPLWTKKLILFAADLKKHLEANNWESRVVFDLFDEPREEYISMLVNVITLLRTIDPEWRFTISGAFMPELNESINFWNLPMDNYCSRAVIEKIQQTGGELTVYNPPGYAYNTALTRVRGAYTWLWLHDIRYVYQWVVNCWREQGERGSDAYRRSSWIAPGPDGPLYTLRMEATRDGIEDYEYLVLLKSEGQRLRNQNTELASRADTLLKKAHKLAWRTPKDECIVVISQDPGLFDQFHREAGALLDEMSRHPLSNP